MIAYAKEEAAQQATEQATRATTLKIAQQLLDVLDKETIALKTGLSIEDIDHEI